MGTSWVTSVVVGAVVVAVLLLSCDSSPSYGVPGSSYQYLVDGGPVNGAVVERWANGNLKLEAYCVEGWFDGSRKEWYQDGTLALHGSHKRGRMIGEWAAWYPSSEKKVSAEYDDNGNLLRQEQWYSSGVRQATAIREGELVRWTFFFESGAVESSGLRKPKGQDIGDWTFWNEDGSPRDRRR